MAESKQNQEHMTIEAFRAKKAASSPTKSSTPTTSQSKSPPNSSKPSTVQSSRPASASRESATKRYVSTENLSGRGGPSLDERQEKVKNLREKQAEERRRKNEERRAAFEERKRRKEENEKERWAALKEQAFQQQVSKENSSPLKSGSGRKLPNLPHDGSAKQPGSSPGASNRPSSLPRPLNRPSSANPIKSPTAGVNKSPSPSSNNNLLRVSTPKELPSPTPAPSKVKGYLDGNKSVSAGNLDSSSSANRRASDGSMGHRPMSGSKQKSRPTSQHSSSLALNKQISKKTTSQELLIPSPGKLSKAHSTSSLQKVGHSGEKVRKAEPKPKAGITDEKTAKQALAERRKKAREEAERQAALDREHQEAERLRKEEEARLQAEEEAKEEARMRELAELLRKQEEERLLLAAEEKERKDREEAERIAAEKVRKEEEEKKAREEEKRRAKEDEERRKQEEAARLERKRRVEEIMSRTRQTATPPATEEISLASLQEPKECGPEDTKRKVSEILQKVKGTSSVQSASNSTSTFVFENSLQSSSELETAGTVNTVNQRRTDPQLDGVENSPEAKEYDPEYTSKNVSEILQRKKGTSMYQATHTPTSISKGEPGQLSEYEHHTVRLVTGVSESRGNAQLDLVENNVESTISGRSVEINGHQSVNNGDLPQSFTNEQQESSHFVTTSRKASGEHRKENIPRNVSEESTSSLISKEGFDMEVISQVPAVITLMDGETAVAES